MSNKISTGFVCIQVLFAERSKTVIKEHFKDINRERDTLGNDLEKSTQ